MKLGRIDYLNCYPFYYHMLERRPLPDVIIHPALPSALNRMMAENKLEISPVSAAAYSWLNKNTLLLPDFCISSTGLVKSVLLVSRLPIEELCGKKLGLTSASMTSVILLKIILKKFYAVEPIYLPSGPRPNLRDFDAALLIGDDALTAQAGAAPYSYDLGELWLERTGLPVVFAVFVVNRAAATANPAGVTAVINSYRASMHCLAEERTKLTAGARRAYPDINCDINSYLENLRYDFSLERKAALKYYFNAAAELGLLKEVRTLEFLDL